MIIATAGHVDHGKTSLVRALTGIDTDRLAEEKRRGMSIDLGFAHARLGDEAAAEVVGFIDVPGHERFVDNMLAGVAAIDLALLVVAADDGPMPQTREHLAILGLLGVPQLAVVLTKIDRVMPERLAAARDEVARLLADGPYAGAAVLPVATPQGIGLPALRRHLAAAARARPARSGAGHFRLAIDRSFTIAGAGRVVTGTVLSGSVHVGDAVQVSPAGTPARVRGLQAQHQVADSACAGQRCALNLAGPALKRAEPQRGDWVLATEAHAPTTRLDVRLQVLASEAKPLNAHTLWQLHLGAAVLNARLAVLDGAKLSPGTTGLAQLVLDRPVAATWGDRFVLRDAAANRSVAGGWVIDPFGPVRGRSRPARLAQLAALAMPRPVAALAALLVVSPDGVDLSQFARARNLRPDDMAAALASLPMQQVPGEAGPLAVLPAHWLGLQDRLLAALAHGHAAQPGSLGVDDSELRTSLAALGADAGDGAVNGRTGCIGRIGRTSRLLQRAAMADLVAHGRVVRAGLRHRLPTHRAVLTHDDKHLLTQVYALLHAGGLRPPIVGELATSLGTALPSLLEFLGRMARQGLLVRVAPNRWYPPEAVAELLAQARALAADSPSGSYDAASYRDRTGIGRNLTVQVLEFLDREGLTHFDGVRHRPVG